MTDWDKIAEEATPLDLLNVSQCFDLPEERRKWLYDKFQEKRNEQNPVVMTVYNQGRIIEIREDGEQEQI